MFVCLCNGVTSQVVADCVEAGARTCNQVAQVCGGGCGMWPLSPNGPCHHRCGRRR